MWENIKSMFRWAWKRIKKHPYLTVFSISALALTGYLFILPMMGDAIAITPSVVGIAAATCTFGGILLGNILGWVGQKIGFIKRDPIPPPDKKFEIKKLPEALQQMVGPMLDPQTLARAATASKGLKILFDPLNLVNKFLHHVARGEQEQAEAMLREEAKRSSAVKAREGKKEKGSTLLFNLLTTKGTVTDLSGRTFPNITALQYTLWAGDRHMWEMILKYLSPNDALKQYAEHETNGASYSLRKKTISKERHYDFSPLKKASKEHIDYTKAGEESKKHWLAIGLAQRDVPAHVAQHYIQSCIGYGNPFKTLVRRPRSMIRHSTTAGEEGTLINMYGTQVSWFHDNLGVSFSIYSGKPFRAVPHASKQTPDNGRFKLEVLLELDEVRSKDYINLGERLKAQSNPTKHPSKIKDTKEEEKETKDVTTSPRRSSRRNQF